MEVCIMKELIAAICISSLTQFAFCQEIVIVTEDFPPFNYKKDGLMQGISTEVVLAAFKAANMKPKIELYPWRHFPRLQQPNYRD